MAVLVGLFALRSEYSASPLALTVQRPISPLKEGLLGHTPECRSDIKNSIIDYRRVPYVDFTPATHSGVRPE
jgi:hypothetical protein